MEELESVTWDQVQRYASQLFDVWVDGREQEWAELAWGFLAKGGLTTYRSEVHRTLVYVRLIVMGVMYREFCAKAWDEWDEPDLKEWLDLLDVGPFRIAQLIGPEFQTHSELSEEELLQVALEQLIERERQVIFRTLAKHFGGKSMLFASLWATNFDFEFDREDEDEDQDEDEGQDEDFEHNAQRPTLRALLDSHEALDLILNDQDHMIIERLQAFEWVNEGMPALNFG